MATFGADKDNALYKVCPFDPTHRMAPSRYDVHIHKCALKSNVELAICPYSSGHRHPKELMAAHLTECQYARQDTIERMQREKLEWERLEANKLKADEEAELAGQMGAMGLGQQVPAPVPEPPAPEEDEPGWGDTPSSYIIPGLEGGKAKVTTAYGINKFFYQQMTPAEKRRYNEKLVLKALNRKARHDNKETFDKEREEKEKREKEKKEEEERIKKENEERKKEKEAKLKAKKDKIKAAKRAAYFAKQSGEGDNDKKQEAGEDDE